MSIFFERSFNSPTIPISTECSFVKCKAMSPPLLTHALSTPATLKESIIVSDTAPATLAMGVKNSPGLQVIKSEHAFHIIQATSPLGILHESLSILLGCDTGFRKFGNSCTSSLRTDENLIQAFSNAPSIEF